MSFPGLGTEKMDRLENPRAGSSGRALYVPVHAVKYRHRLQKIFASARQRHVGMRGFSECIRFSSHFNLHSGNQFCEHTIRDCTGVFYRIRRHLLSDYARGIGGRSGLYKVFESDELSALSVAGRRREAFDIAESYTVALYRFLFWY